MIKGFLLLALCGVAFGRVAPRSGDICPHCPLFDPMPLMPVKKLPVNPNQRIVGGTETTPHQYPFAVHLSIDSLYFCGGSIIAANRVLTAAHCAEGAASVVVTAGDHSRSVNEGTEQTARAQGATNIIVHPQWNSANLHNDVAVLRLSTSLTLNTNVRAVTLTNNGNEFYVGQTATAIGWGRTSDASGAISNVLRHVQVPVVNDQICRDTYGAIITDSMLCVSTTGGRGTCNGDSGGPLVSSGGQQIGVVSFGASAGCEAGYPAGFSEVSYFRTWILQQ